MSHISFRSVRRSAAVGLIAGVLSGLVYCGELHGQSPAAKGSSGNQSTGAASSSGNATSGRGSGGSISGSAPGNTTAGTTRTSTGNAPGNSTGSTSGYWAGSHGSNYVGGNGNAGRGQWGNGVGSTGGGYGTDSAYGSAGSYGGAGVYNAAPYGLTDMGATYLPGSVNPLPHWREFGTTPLPAAFKANIDNVSTNVPVTSAPALPPSANLTPIAISSDSGASAGSTNPGSGPTGTLTLGFDPPRALPDQVGQSIAKRLAKLPSLHFVGAARVDISGRTAYLRGRVATEHERDLAERVVLLEAGIDDVVNLIEVSGSQAPALPAPPIPGLPSPPIPGLPAPPAPATARTS